MDFSEFTREQSWRISPSVPVRTPRVPSFWIAAAKLREKRELERA
jgi:hypothetical protein